MANFTLSGTLTTNADGSMSINATATPQTTTGTGTGTTTPPTSGGTGTTTPPTSGGTTTTPPPVTTPPVTTPPVTTPPTSGSTGIVPYTGYAKTGPTTAPVTGSGILEPAETPGATQPQGKTYNIPQITMPTVAGQTYVDPVFGTTIRRLPTNWVSTYSELQAFSTDDTLFLGTIFGTGYGVCKYPSMQIVQMPAGFAGCIAPRWLPGTHMLVSTDYAWANPLGGSQLANVTVHLWDCDAGTVKVLFTLPQFVACNSNFAEEQFSLDGQFTSLYAQDSAGVWHACIVNLCTGQVLSNLPDAQFSSLDWIAPSPLGDMMLTASNGTSPPSGQSHGSGMECYNVNTGAFLRQIVDRDDHSSKGLDASGNEILLTTTLTSKYNNNVPGIVTYNLSTGAMIQLRSINWTAAPQHLSLMGPPGRYAMDMGWGKFNTSTGARLAPEFTGLDPFEGELVVMFADGSARRICHHRNNEGLFTDPNAMYFNETKATMSKSGKYIAFCSNNNGQFTSPQGWVAELTGI